MKPPRLQEGDRIGVVAPAGPVLEREIRPALDFLESRGFKTICAPHLFDHTGYLAGNDRARVGDFHRMFRDRKVRAVLCARGGYGSHRILEKLDYRLFREHPKIVVGYSDITALLWALFKKSGLITFHGPVLRDLLGAGGRNAYLLLKLMTSGELPAVEFRRGEALRHGRAEGTVIGGNLSLICHLVGTPFFPSLKGKLLFIEEKGEPLFRIDRMLTHLVLSGELGKCAGLMVGTFEQCGDSALVMDLIRGKSSRLKMPVVTGLPVGHGEENVPLPIGVRGILDTKTMTLEIRRPCVTK